MRLIDAEFFDKMLIDAQAKCAGLNNTFKYGFLSTVRANLERCPSVDAEPIKRGKWLTCEDGWGGVHYQCSVCGQEWCLNDGTPEENGMNYCPHCGADMREGWRRMCEYGGATTWVPTRRCSVCKRIYSPSTTMCPYCGGEQKAVVNKTERTVDWALPTTITGSESENVELKEVEKDG